MALVQAMVIVATTVQGFVVSHMEKRTPAKGTRGLTNGMELLGSTAAAEETRGMTSMAGGSVETSDKPSIGPHTVISAR
jgi:hypothetical protein